MNRFSKKHVVVMLFTVLILLIALFSTAPSIAAESPDEKISIEGVVDVLNFDEDGKPSAIVITTDDGEYEVMEGGKFSELMGLIGSRVVASGVEKEEEGFRYIIVEEYTVEEK